MAWRVLHDAPRWLFLAALVYAPWDYGCTTERGTVALNWILAAAVVLWLFDSFLVRQRPAVPRTLLVIILALLMLGWWMALNAHWIYDSDYFIFIPITDWLSAWPGAVDRAISSAWMLRATLLLGATYFVADLSRRPTWVLRLWWTIAIAGGSIALLGVLQKATEAPMIFWQPTSPFHTNVFFATYYYHANAGAFLNLVLPATWGLAVRMWSRPTSSVSRALSLGALLILLIAILSDTSRVAQLIAVFLVVALLIKSRKMLARIGRGLELKIALFGLAALLVALLAIAAASHLEQPLHRWQMLAEQLPGDPRWLKSQAALGAVPDAGWFGFGPGTFGVVFPYYTGPLGDRVRGAWHFLHEDYLQTLLEWGRIGSAFWAAFFFGGMAVAIHKLRSSAAHEWSSRYRSLLTLAVLALTGVAFHSLVDFPLQIASLQLYVVAYLGICWGSAVWDKNGNRITRQRVTSNE